MAMNPDVKSLLVEALRSDRYKQDTTYNVLKTEGGCYCVLGVAADLVDPDAWQPSDCNGAMQHGWGYVSMPSPAVLKRIGITEEEAWGLIDLNDRIELSFDQLANHIEVHF